MIAFMIASNSYIGTHEYYIKRGLKSAELSCEVLRRGVYYFPITRLAIVVIAM